MRILTIINISNRSRIQADSGYIFYNLLSSYFSVENEFFVVSPYPLEDKKSVYIKRHILTFVNICLLFGNNLINKFFLYIRG